MTFLESWAKFADYMGLSDYEAKIYIALVEKHPLGARQIGLKTGVPRTKVYGTLKKLVEYGFVLKAPGRPQQYAPVAPATITRDNRELMAERASDFNSLVVQLSNEFEEPKEKSLESLNLWFSDDSEYILKLFRDYIFDSDPLVIIADGKGMQLLNNKLQSAIDSFEAKSDVLICTSMNYEGLLYREFQAIDSVRMNSVELGLNMVYLTSSLGFAFAKVSPEGDRFIWAFFGSGEQLETLFTLIPYVLLKYGRGGEPGSKSIAFPPGMGEKTPLHHQG